MAGGAAGRPVSVLLLLLACTSSACQGNGNGTGDATPAPRDERPAASPNIVVFLVDDMGWQDTSVPFHVERTPLNERYRTPNMERLAERGTKFTQAYVSSICSPTRVSLMTGLNAARHRVTSWTLRKGVATDSDHPQLELPAWNVNGMSPEPGVERTVVARALPDYLREAGYRTIHVGKAHFGARGTPASDPLRIGFDVNVAGHAAGAPASYHGKDGFAKGGDEPSIWDVPGLEQYHGEDIFLTDALTREACRHVRETVRNDEPFFLYLAHYAVHTPIMADARYVGDYEGLHPTEAAYASMVEGVDASLGSVLDTLEELGVADNTIVLMTSDNGGLTHAARGGEKHAHNAPLRSGKGSAYEGGIRVPMIVAWPGVTEPGAVCTEPIIIEDWLPTLIEIAGARLDRPVDGRSFVDHLRRDAPDQDTTRDLVWHQPNAWIGPGDPQLGPHSSLRRGDWKLIYRHDREGPERYQLFHLGTDLGETRDLAAERPDRVDELAEALAIALRRYNAQMPIDKRTGRAVPLPG